MGTISAPWLAAQTGAEDGRDLARLLAALPEGAVGVDLDPGALVVNGFSPLEAVEALGPRILHVHARDGVRDLARKRGLEVPLGRGSVDFPALLACSKSWAIAAISRWPAINRTTPPMSSARRSGI